MESIYYTDISIENYYHKKTIGRGMSYITKYFDKDMKLHRTDGPALINSAFSKYYIHGVHYETVEKFNEQLKNMSLKNKILKFLKD
jgi:hypothetical protein